jgi:hypothetical protein
MISLSVDLDCGDIQVEASQFVAQRFTLGGDKEPMQLLFKYVEILDGLVCCATLPQKVLQLIHRMGLTGQAGTVLQCLHRGSPLASVVCVRTPVSIMGSATWLS